MAAVAEKKDPSAKFGSQVDEQLAEATSRIRGHDLAFGGLVLGAMVLVYATAMILLDRSLNLPEWVRQASLGGFAALFLAVGYLTIVRPLRRRINPLYAAVQVERTIEDPKNSVVGYVDAREREDLHPSVRTAVAARAARSMGKADLNRAVDHRSLLYVGGVAVVFLLALVVLFFAFRPAQFASLAGRAFVPFSSDPIATRTRLTLTKPESGDVTITAGQPVMVAVHVGGKVPSPDQPDRLRVLIRHNPADPNYEEVPLEKGDDSRDWQVRVPDYLVQNGFWYKVAGGDAETPEYRVTVRSLPLFTEFEAVYEFPAYLRRKPQTDRNPWLEAPRGTKVTLTARTNREVRDGRMTVEPTGEVIPGKPVVGRPDSLRFELKLGANGSYRVSFTSTAGERNSDPPQYTIRVTEDAKPTVEITSPEEDEATRPANGQLAVDGTVGDDQGIAKVMLRMRLVTAEGGTRPLADKPYMEGKSFLRAKDNTYPTDLVYKDSVDLAKLTDPAGKPVGVKADDVIEYWLEALDNCTEAKLPDEAAAAWKTPVGNVGKSKVKRVRLTPAKTAEEDQEKQAQQKQQRRDQERQHNQAQQKKFDTENRERDPQNAPPQQDEGAKKDNPPKKDAAQPKNPEAKQGGGENQPMGQEGMGEPMPPKKDPENKGSKDPNAKGGENPQPMPGGMGEPNTGQQPETAPPPSTPEDRKLEDQAKELQKEIDRQRQSGGEARGNPNAGENDRADPDQPKPKPAGGPPPDASREKEPPKPNDMTNPMGGSDASQSKPEGDVKPPPPPSGPKPDAQQPDPMKGGQDQPAKNKDAPQDLGGNNAASDQPEPKKPEEGTPQPKNEPNPGGDAKPATQKKDGDTNPMGGGMPQQDPTAEAGKPKPTPSNDRGMEKDPAAQPQQQPGNPPQNEGAGGAKPDKAPNPAETKPKGGPMGEKPEASEPKPGDTGMDPNAGEAKPNEPRQPMGGAGKEKQPQPAEERGSPEGQPEGQPNAGGQPDQQKVRDAARNLNNPDPQKRKAAEGELDREIGEPNRQKAKDLADDLNSKDQKKRKDAEEKLERLTRKGQEEKQEQAKKDAQAKKDQDELKKKNQKNGGKGQSKDDVSPQDAGNAAKDLASGDDAKKQQAREKLDRSVGEQNRKEIEKQADQLQKDLKSDDQATREGAEKKLGELGKKAEKQAAEGMAKKDREQGKAEELAKKDRGQKGPNEQAEKGKEPTKEEIEAMQKKAEDLASDDKEKRDAAEKEFDDKIGKENREQLQQAMKDAKSGDPQKQKDAQKKAEEMVKKAGGERDPKGRRDGVADENLPTPKPHEDDPRNRLKSAELQLQRFKEVKNNPELQKLAGFENPEEFERFLEGREKMVDRMRQQVEAAEKAAAENPPPGPTGRPINVGDGGKLEHRKTDDSKLSTPGAGAAAPGFGDAQRKFQEAATQGKPKK